MKKIFTSFFVAGLLLISRNQAHSQCYSALQLDGIDEYLHTPFANYTFNNFTLEMWINSSNYNQNEHYISLYQNAYLVLGGWNAGGAFTTWADGLTPIEIGSTPVNTPAVGTWHHVAFVYDGTNQILYIDGVAVTTTATNYAVTNSATFASGLVIGARYTQNTQFSPTSFEDVRIWNVARTPAELNANISSNLSGSEPGLVAYYRFENGPSSTTVSDLTGNGNTLTMYNMEPSDWISGPLASVQTTDVQNTCGPLTWIDGVTYNSSTTGVTYTYVGGSVAGCDSIVTLDLTVNTPSQGTDVQVACGSFTWIDNNTYTSSNNSAVYTISGGSANGCDSIVTLDLTINPASQSTDTQVACGSFTWIDNNTYTSSNNSAVYTISGGSANGCDSIVTLDLTINSASQSTDTHVACGSFTWIDNNTYTTNNNTAVFTISGGAANGCDSLVTLNLTINNVDVTVASSAVQLTANASNAQYQWVDCDNNFAAIQGANSQTFTATENGNYAVIVSASNGCSDTSACVAITSVSVEENTLENGIVVSPNPTDGAFSITSSNYAGEVNIKVIDVTGKVIFNSNQNIGPNTDASIDLSDMADGIYVVNLSDSHQTHSIRVVKN